jgi:prolyl-tRNA synthetase
LNQLKIDANEVVKALKRPTWGPIPTKNLTSFKRMVVLLDENVQNLPKVLNADSSSHQVLSVPVDCHVSSFIEAQPGDTCANCKASPLVSNPAIEVGHTFYLGTKYSEPLDATIQLPGSSRVPIEMGCFGIGVSRMISAIAESTHDEKGLKWPLSVTPYSVEIIIPVKKKVEADPIVQFAEKLYQDLKVKLGEEEVMLDDRTNVHFLEKMAESDRAGIPFQVMIGPKGFKAGEAEITCRMTGENMVVPLDEVVQVVVGKVY